MKILARMRARWHEAMASRAAFAVARHSRAAEKHFQNIKGGGSRKPRERAAARLDLAARMYREGATDGMIAAALGVTPAQMALLLGALK